MAFLNIKAKNGEMFIDLTGTDIIIAEGKIRIEKNGKLYCYAIETLDGSQKVEDISQSLAIGIAMKSAIPFNEREEANDFKG